MENKKKILLQEKYMSEWKSISKIYNEYSCNFITLMTSKYSTADFELEPGMSSALPQAFRI